MCIIHVHVMCVSSTQPYGPPFDETFEGEDKTVQEWRSKLLPEHLIHQVEVCLTHGVMVV